ncbi:hypothetical protein WICPIJ_007993 [Wickerhamomyces pijperi]|uniref:Uncharacterized protein n=1 Tax=Wickerhamomyces pijperi TaxID=599730 RepID=A0A9P8TJE4_WICPI|nr:hypothetical protein WICPIJ_007993 [Wickerhamomyces pijperi]
MSSSDSSLASSTASSAAASAEPEAAAAPAAGAAPPVGTEANLVLPSAMTSAMALPSKEANKAATLDSSTSIPAADKT